MVMRVSRQGLFLALVSLWLGACSSEPSLSVDPVILEFMTHENGPTPEFKTLKAKINHLGDPVFIGVAFSDTALSEVIADISENPFTVQVKVKETRLLGAGIFTDELVIAVCEDSSCDQHISGSPKLVLVNHTVGRPLQSKPAALSLTQVLGSDAHPAPVSLSIEGRSVDWKASSDVSWIRLTGPTEGRTPSSLGVEFDTTGLGLGTHTGHVSLDNRGTGGLTRVPVTLEVVAPSLSATPSALSFVGPEFPALPSQPLTLRLDTGGVAYDWTAELDMGGGPQWLTLSSTSGKASAAGSPLTVSVNPAAGLKSGSYSANLRFTSVAGGHTATLTVPVSLSLPAHTLWVTDNGVGLVSTPSLSHLTHSVTVKDSWGPTAATPWTASSSQPWLSVTPSGISGGLLTLSADPTGLTANAFHSATVTVHSSDSSVLRSETVQVGLWVGNTPLKNSALWPHPYTFEAQLELDPIRPYAYVHDRRNLSVYNIYTGDLVTSLPELGRGTNSLRSMVATSDGAALYLLDIDESRRARMVKVDLSTFAITSPWQWPDFSTGIRPELIRYVRTSGHDLLMTSAGQVHEPATGTVLYTAEANSIFSTAGEVSASLDGERLCAIDNRTGSSLLSCYTLEYWELGDGLFTLALRNPGPVALSPAAQALELNQDGSRIYLTHYLPFALTVFDGQTLSQSAQLSTRSGDSIIEVGPDNRLYGHTTNFSDYTFWAYDNAGTFVGSSQATLNSNSGKRKVSGDGKRIVMVTQEGLAFITAP